MDILFLPTLNHLNICVADAWNTIILCLHSPGFGIHLLFDFLRMLPEDSYLRQWASAKVFTGSFNHTDLAKFENLTTSFQQLEKSGNYIKSKYI